MSRDLLILFWRRPRICRYF